MTVQRRGAWRAGLGQCLARHFEKVQPHIEKRIMSRMKRTTNASANTIFMFCHHIALRRPTDCFWNCEAWLPRASDLSTSSSRCSPRSTTASMFARIMSVTSPISSCTACSLPIPGPPWPPDEAVVAPPPTAPRCRASTWQRSAGAGARHGTCGPEARQYRKRDSLCCYEAVRWLAATSAVLEIGTDKRRITQDRLAT